MEEGVRGAGLVVSSDGFANVLNAGAGDGDFEEELRGETVVLHVEVRDVDGIRGEKHDGVDLEEWVGSEEIEILWFLTEFHITHFLLIKIPY